MCIHFQALLAPKLWEHTLVAHAGRVVAHQGLGLRAASSTERSSSVVRSFMAGS